MASATPPTDPRARAFCDALADAIAGQVLRDLEHAAPLSPLDRLNEGPAIERSEGLAVG